MHLEIDPGMIDRGRLDAQAQAPRLVAEFGELVRVALVQRHRRRNELHGIVRLEPAGLVGDQRIGRRVALVEAVVGEFGQQIENLVRLGLEHAALHGAAHEAVALGVHLRLDLLAHGAAQQIRLAQRIARQGLGRLHHLFLVDDDAAGLLQDRAQGLMRIIRLLLAQLDRAIGGDIGHGAGSIERHQGDDVLQPVGAHLRQRLAHACAFQLEHADGLAAPEHLVGLGVVEGDLGEVHHHAALGQQLHGRGQGREGLQAQKVEFHEAGGLHPFHVELGGGHFGFGVAVERHQLMQGAVADDDARRMGGGVGIEPLQGLGDLQHARHPRIGLGGLAQARLALEGLGEADGGRRVLRHQLGELVHLAQRHFQHAAHIAHDAARQKRAEGDDLRHPVRPIAVAHIADDLVAPVLTEIDVEIGHGHAFGIQEALEEQAEAQGIKIGDGEGVGDQRACARAAPRPHRNALGLGPFDEVGHDEEVAGEFHAGDDAQLEIQPLFVIAGGQARRRPMGGEARRQTLLRLLAHLQRLRDLRRLAILSGGARGEARQDGLAGQGPVGAAKRDLDGVGGSLRQIGEERQHLGPGLEAVLGGDLATVGLGDQRAIGDAQ